MNGGISQWVTTCNRDVLYFMEASPECLDRVIWGPDCENAHTVDFKFPVHDGAIGGSQMCDHVSNGNFRKSKHVIIKGCQIQSVDCFQDLFFSFLL